MKVLVIFAASVICLVSCAPALDSATLIASSPSKKNDKRGIGLGYTALSGLGYDHHAPLGYTGIGYHPAAASGYLSPLATTTVIKSGYTGIPTAGAGYGGYDGYGKYAYSGFYPGYTGGYSTGYGALGYAGIPASAGSSYGKIVQPATATYSKVIQTYPHYGSSISAVSPALGYSGIGGYHYGY